MSIWKKGISSILLQRITYAGRGSMAGSLDIKFTDCGSNWLEATMPVTTQSSNASGFLHSGASATLAETLAVTAAALQNGSDKTAIAIDVNTSNLRSVKSGSEVTARAYPVKLSNKLQLWEVKIHESGKEEQGLICVGRLTVTLGKFLHKPELEEKDKDSKGDDWDNFLD